ncbi:MAG TPA: hypothetical protein PKK10_05235 [Woeseiaceae bacterium]|nr:hypothetical protein [Woeseiaceae bacterium]
MTGPFAATSQCGTDNSQRRQGGKNAAFSDLSHALERLIFENWPGQDQPNSVG